ncbi:MAG: hypothetical protein ACRCXM_14205 [Beijerinckiaceae bacterium]
MKITSICLALGLALAGCQTTSEQNSSLSDSERVAISVGKDYRKKIVEFIKRTAKDPYSIRSAEIAPPTMGFVGIVRGGNQPVVCARFNGKNSFGAYIGVKPVAFIFRDGSITDAIFENPLACGDQGYSPFPELEKIT